MTRAAVLLAVFAIGVLGLAFTGSTWPYTWSFTGVTGTFRGGLEFFTTWGMACLAFLAVSSVQAFRAWRGHRGRAATVVTGLLGMIVGGLLAHGLSRTVVLRPGLYVANERIERCGTIELYEHNGAVNGIRCTTWEDRGQEVIRGALSGYFVMDVLRLPGPMARMVPHLTDGGFEVRFEGSSRAVQFHPVPDRIEFERAVLEAMREDVRRLLWNCGSLDPWWEATLDLERRYIPNWAGTATAHGSASMASERIETRVQNGRPQVCVHITTREPFGPGLQEITLVRTRDQEGGSDTHFGVDAAVYASSGWPRDGEHPIATCEPDVYPTGNFSK